MTMTLTERLVNRISRKPAADRTGSSRRGFLGGAALVGAALAVDPWGYLVRPASAYASVCGTDAGCADGYSVFCCTINNGRNSCPPNSFIGGWWKADNASFCGGAARYYIDCNAFKGGPWQCRCAEGTCDQRRVACNQFRYGQCRTDIPASETGPVVCRMVSCTPPWQQFAGVCGSSSATDNRTATHSAPCLSGSPPIGSVDIIAAKGNAARIAGWALDRDQPATSIPVSVYVDGVGIGRFTTSRARSDVNRKFGATGNHGFDLTIPMNPGTHAIKVYAINVGGGSGNPVIGSGSVKVGRRPVGHLDSVVPLSNGIRLRGWAYDPDLPATEISVAVYRDGVGVRWFPTGRARRDVNTAFGITGNHGFDITIDSPPGRHTVSVFGINVGGGSGNPQIGQGTTVVGSPPRGHLDVVSAGSGSIRLRGWAYDPDAAGARIDVAVYVDGKGISRYPTTVQRSDVNRIYGITGTHGFSISVPGITAGPHTVAVYGINVGPSGANPLLGTGSVVVP